MTSHGVSGVCFLRGKMTEDFKKWLCDLAGIKYWTVIDRYGNSWEENISLEILIKAMWTINRQEGSKYKIRLEDIYCFTVTNEWSDSVAVTDVDFYFKDYNNSEQEALTAALEYIFKETKNKK